MDRVRAVGRLVHPFQTIQARKGVQLADILVEIEFQRRVENGEALTMLTHEAEKLSDWLTQKYPKMAPMAPKTVENCIRDCHRTGNPRNNRRTGISSLIFRSRHRRPCPCVFNNTRTNSHEREQS